MATIAIESVSSIAYVPPNSMTDFSGNASIRRAAPVATHTPKAEALGAATMRRLEAGKRAWKLSDLPEWLNEEFYREQIQPRLATFTVSAIALALEISKPYATDIRSGQRVPHPRHWQALAKLAALPSTSD